VQQHLSQQEIHRTGLPVQAPSSIKNDTLKNRHCSAELRAAVSEKDKIMAIIKMVLNETKWLLEFIVRSKS
jgi:hypothetical protein